MPATRRRFIVILNEKAGAAARGVDGLSPDALSRAFTEAGAKVDLRARPPVRVEHELSAAVEARPDAVIVGGGDGTVRSAAAALADTGIPLGVLPLGTLNHFAKDLRLPAPWREAVRALAAAAPRAVDIAAVNDHVFVNNCSLGAYAAAVRRRDALREATGGAKWPAMLRASFEVFLRLRRLRLRVALDDAPPRAVRTPLLVVANNRYSGRVLAPSLRPRLDEGRLWIYTAHVHRHLAALRLAASALLRHLEAPAALAADPATEATVETAPGFAPIAADGEPLELRGALRFRIRPGALRVLAPPPKSPADS